MDNLTAKIAAGTGVASSMAGTGLVVANLDGATIGLIIAAVGSLITAVVGAVMTVMNGRTNNRIAEMKASNELELTKMRLQMESQARLSQQNNTALTNLHTAVAQNTVETVKSTAAADQAKVRVEQLVDKLPVKQSETEEPQ